MIRKYVAAVLGVLSIVTATVAVAELLPKTPTPAPEAEKPAPDSPEVPEIVQGTLPVTCMLFSDVQQMLQSRGQAPIAWGMNEEMPAQSLNSFFLTAGRDATFNLVIANMENNLACFVLVGPNLQVNLGR